MLRTCAWCLIVVTVFALTACRFETSQEGSTAKGTAIVSAPSPSASETPSAPAAPAVVFQPVAGFQPDGVVTAQLQVGSYVFLSGEFHNLTGHGQTFARPGLALIDVDNATSPEWMSVDGTVEAFAQIDQVVYATGRFQHVTTPVLSVQPRPAIAGFDAQTAELVDVTFDLPSDGSATDAVLLHGVVYIQGDIKPYDSKIAAFNPASGAFVRCVPSYRYLCVYSDNWSEMLDHGTVVEYCPVHGSPQDSKSYRFDLETGKQVPL